MNSTVRISVRAVFGETLKQFQNLRQVLATFDRQVAAVNKSLVNMSDMFDRNAAHATAWAAKVKAAGMAAGAVVPAGKVGALGSGGAATAAADAGLVGYGKRLDSLGASMIGLGKKAQWTGSTLMYSLTVPLAAVLYEGVKANNAYQTAMTSLRQAYNQAGKGATDLAARNRAWAADSQALEGIFLKMSNAYGISRPIIAENAAELARMGDRSLSLAQDLDTAARMQRTYNISAKDSIQIVSQSRAAWGASSAATRDNANALATMQEMGRGAFANLAAGVNQISQPARVAGLTYKQAAAYVALLLQTVNSSQGRTLGNSLTTVFARLSQVVPRARDELKRYGVSVTDSAWANDNLQQKLQVIGKVWDRLTRSQQEHLAISLAGQRQYRALIPLLNDVASKHGTLAQIMQEVGNKTKNAAFAQHQLELALANPAANFARLKVNLQNFAMTVAQQLTPALIKLGHILVGATTWFSGLPAGVRQFLLIGLAVGALLGPLIKIGGSFVTLGGVLVRVGAFVLTSLLPMMFTPLGGIVALLGVIIFAANSFGVSMSDIFGGLVTALAFVAHALAQIFIWIADLFGAGASAADQMTNSMNRVAAATGGAKAATDGFGANAPPTVGGGAAGPAMNQMAPVLANNAGNLASGAQSVKDAAAAVAGLRTQVNAARQAVLDQTASMLGLKIQTQQAANALKAANLELRILNQRKAEMTEQRNLLGNPQALLSQAQALASMGRAIAGAGNTALARRYMEQARLAQQQAGKASSLDSGLNKINAQIDAQQALINQLTAAHDALTTQYQAEQNKLADLRNTYASLNQQLTEARQNLGNLKSAAKGAKDAMAPGNTPGLGNPGFQNSIGDLNKYSGALAHFKPTFPGFGNFFDKMKADWKRGWDGFGGQGVITRVIEAVLALGLTAVALNLSKRFGGIFAPLIAKLRGLFGKGLGADVAKAAESAGGKDLFMLGGAGAAAMLARGGLGKIAAAEMGAAGEKAGASFLARLGGHLKGAKGLGFFKTLGLSIGLDYAFNKIRGNAAPGSNRDVYASTGNGMAQGALFGAMAGPAGAALGALVGGTLSWWSAIHRVSDGLKSLRTVEKDSNAVTDAATQAYLHSGGALDANLTKIAATVLAHTNLNGVAARAKISHEQLAAAVAGSDAQFNKVLATLQNSAHPNQNEITALMVLHDKFKAGQDAASAYAAAHGLAMASEMRHGRELDLLSGKMGLLIDNTHTAKDYAKLFKDNIDSLSVAVHHNGTTLDGATSAGRANIKAVRDGVNAAIAHSQAVYRQTGNLAAADRALRTDMGNLRNHAQHLGMNKDQVQHLIDTMIVLNNTSANPQISVNTQQAYNDLGSFNQFFNKYLTDMQNIANQNPIQLGLTGGLVGSSPIPHAMGGVTTRAHIGLIGEAGPEAILPLSTSNPFVSMFANTVAGRLASTMNRYAAGANKMGGSVSHVNSHNTTTNNVKVDVTMAAPEHRPMSEADISRELGKILNKAGVF